MCVKILDRLSPLLGSRIHRVLLLFPTLINIGATPSGLKQGTSVCSRMISSGLAGLVSCLPSSVRHWGIKSNEGPDLPQKSVESTDRFLSSNSVSNAIFLFKHEAEEIKELDTQVLRAHADKLVLYFGTTDGWAPLSHRDEIMEKVPECRVLTDQNETPHAFSLRHSDYVADVCWKEIVAVFENTVPGPEGVPEGNRYCL